MTTDRRTFAIVLATALMANCAEPPPPAPVFTMVTYDVTTTLDTFSFETSCPVTMYCTHSRAFTGAELSGTLSLIDSVSSPDHITVAGTFGGTFCDSIDYAGLTGCKRVGPMPTRDYGSSQYPRPAIFDAGFLTVIGGQYTSEGSQPVVRFMFDGPVVGDSLSGRVWWSQIVYRSPPTHRGRFVARRRK